MARFERTLQDEGYAVANIDYPSRKYPIESLAPEAVGRGLEACRKMQAQKIHFVTHSLGGILVRHFLSPGITCYGRGESGRVKDMFTIANAKVLVEGFQVDMTALLDVDKSDTDVY